MKWEVRETRNRPAPAGKPNPAGVVRRQVHRVRVERVGLPAVEVEVETDEIPDDFVHDVVGWREDVAGQYHSPWVEQDGTWVEAEKAPNGKPWKRVKNPDRLQGQLLGALMPLGHEETVHNARGMRRRFVRAGAVVAIDGDPYINPDAGMIEVRVTEAFDADGTPLDVGDGIFQVWGLPPKVDGVFDPAAAVEAHLVRALRTRNGRRHDA